MEYFMVPAQKVPSLQHFRKTEKDVIGGLCRYVQVARASRSTRSSAAYYCEKPSVLGGAHAPRQHASSCSLCYCVHDPLAGPLWELVGVKCCPCTPIRSSDRFCSHPGARPAVLYGIFECEIDVFCGEQTQTTWLRGHHAAYPAPRRIPFALCILVLPPATPVSPIGCSDLRATSYTRVGWKVKERGWLCFSGSGATLLRYCG